LISLRNALPTWAHPLEVVEDGLACLGAQIGHGRRLLRSADLRAQHEIEVAGFGEIVLGAALARAARLGVLELVGAETLLAGATVHHRIAEVLDVAGRLPRARVRNDRAVDAFHIGALAHHAAPPERTQVALQLGPERPVIPEAVDATVDLAGLEDEAPPRAQRDEILHALESARRVICLHGSIRRAGC
jgi:hypothetical protein